MIHPRRCGPNSPNEAVVIGGGSAGCMAAIAVKEQNPEVNVLIIEKGGVLDQ